METICTMVPSVSSTIVHHCSGRLKYGISAMKERPLTTETLALNLRTLMTRAKMTKKRLAQLSGVSERMVGYVLARERTATIEMADMLAKPFGLTGWQILMPGLPIPEAKAGDVEALIRKYALASEDGKNYISRVADKESKYDRKK